LVTLTGLDLVRLVLEKVACEELMRQDIPHVNDTAGQETFLAMFRETMSRAIMERDLLNDFYRHLNTMADLTPAVGLPWSATPDILPPSHSYVVCLASTRPLDIRHQPESGVVEVGVRGKILSFNEATLPLLKFLEETQGVAASVFYEKFGASYGHEELRVFLTDLVKHGILSLTLTEDKDSEYIGEEVKVLA